MMVKVDSKEGCRLRAALERAVEKGNRADAADALGKLRTLEPDEARWAHRLGETLSRLGRGQEAAQAFVDASRLYAKQGFLARAIAVAKLAVDINPARADVLETLDTRKAQELRRETRPTLRPSGLAGFPSSAARAAQSLEPHAEAAKDEIRFNDAPLSCAVDVHGADLGLPLLSDEDVVLDEDDDMDAEKISRMAGAMLFADIPAEALADLAREAERVELPDHGPIFVEGAPADALLVIVEGRAQVSRAGTAGVELREGDVLGESALLSDGVGSADVRARGAFVALRVSKAALDRLVAKHPVVGEVLFDLLARRLVATALETCPLFAPLDAPTRAEIARAFEVRRARVGTVLQDEGKKGDALYLVLCGVLRATGSKGTERLVHGAFVGNDTLVSRAPAARTVTVATDSVLLRLPAAKFATLATPRPPAQAVREVAP
jgi:CRP-like cAMP-binding protein